MTIKVVRVRLDQFYTKPYMAKACYHFLAKTMKYITSKALDQFYFIEPSVGCGDFFDVLPIKHRIGIDIDPIRPDVLKADFLQWTPPQPLGREETINYWYSTFWTSS